MPFDPGSLRSRATWISGTLHKLTGRPALTTKIRGGGFKITIRVDSSRMSADMTMAVLRTISMGDDFGHDRNRRWESAWSEVTRPSETDEVPQ